jgi:DNA polymerase-3 subunit delta'
MLPSSADSLLKLIEEPPPETVIVLTARDPDNLLPTIQSRAQKMRFKPIEMPEIVEYLESGYELPRQKAEFIARLSEGSIGRALNSLEDDNESSTRQIAFLMFKSIFHKDNPSSVALLNELINPNDRGQIEHILSFWQSFLGDLILLKYGRSSSELMNVDLSGELELLTSRIISSDDFSQMRENIKDMLNSLRRNVHIRPAMTALLLDLRRRGNQST